MLQTVYVKPKQGGRVRQPERGSRVMPDEGALVPRNGYYTRLIMAGDVVISTAPEKPKAAPAPEAAKPEEEVHATVERAAPVETVAPAAVKPSPPAPPSSISDRR